jgi:hypothetical protein
VIVALLLRRNIMTMTRFHHSSIGGVDAGCGIDVRCGDGIRTDGVRRDRAGRVLPALPLPRGPSPRRFLMRRGSVDWGGGDVLEASWGWRRRRGAKRRIDFDTTATQEYNFAETFLLRRGVALSVAMGETVHRFNQAPHLNMKKMFFRVVRIPCQICSKKEEKTCSGGTSANDNAPNRETGKRSMFKKTRRVKL